MKNLNYPLLHRDPLLITASALFSLFLGMTLTAFPANIPDAYATGACAAGWRVGATQTIDCHGVCRNVGKSGGFDFFVPTATAGEWTRFRENPATNATVASCIVLKRVFVTSIRYHANLGGLAGADNKCRARAGAAGLGGDWRALLSTTLVNARDRMVYNWTFLVTMDGRKIAGSEAELWSGAIRNAINRDEFNVLIPHTVEVWTGTSACGHSTTNNPWHTCMDWTLGFDVPGHWAVYGNTTEMGGRWIHDRVFGCWLMPRLYCVEQ